MQKLILTWLLIPVVRFIDKMLNGSLLDKLLELKAADAVVDAALDTAQDEVHKILDTAIAVAEKDTDDTKSK